MQEKIIYKKSDFYYHLPEEQIAQTLADDPTDGAVDTLLQLALEHGGRDNITMILCRVKRTSFWTL